MSNLLIRDLDPEMTRTLEQRARNHDRDASEEARHLLRQSLGLQNPETNHFVGPPPGMGMGTWMRSLVPPECRGDDLVFEVDSPESPPPDFS